MRKTALFFLLPAALFGAYPYYSINQQGVPANWTANGDPTFSSANGGSQISSVAVPDGTNEYEVRTTLSIKASGGTFITYLRATSDSLNDAGIYYAVEFQNVQVNGASCVGTLQVRKRLGPDQNVTFGGSPEPCKDGMTWRIARSASGIWISSDLGSLMVIYDTDIASGKPGFGARDLNTAAGNGFASVSLGPADHTPPAVVTPQSVASSVSANQVDFAMARCRRRPQHRWRPQRIGHLDIPGLSQWHMAH